MHGFFDDFDTLNLAASSASGGTQSIFGNAPSAASDEIAGGFYDWDAFDQLVDEAGGELPGVPNVSTGAAGVEAAGFGDDDFQGAPKPAPNPNVPPPPPKKDETEGRPLWQYLLLAAALAGGAYLVLSDD